MDETRRKTAIRQIAAEMVNFEGREITSLFRTASSEFGLVDNWRQSVPSATRQLTIIQRLRDEDDQVIENLLEGLGIDFVQTDSSPAAANPEGPIFVVHGHDHTVLQYVVRMLERITAREVVVLHEQPNAGLTLLEKFERHGADASFAVILLTGDDEGRSVKATELQRRARQNVVFELGFFFGKLGRNRVAVIAEPDVERPSDIDGLAYISHDPGGAWKVELARELRAADIEVEYSRMP